MSYITDVSTLKPSNTGHFRITQEVQDGHVPPRNLGSHTLAAAARLLKQARKAPGNNGTINLQIQVGPGDRDWKIIPEEKIIEALAIKPYRVRAQISPGAMGPAAMGAAFREGRRERG